MMRLHLLLLTLWSNYAFATTYYVSILGNNTDGRTPAKAWQTISKLNSSSASIQPGDSVLFNRGETFFGPLIISRSGTSSAPIVFGYFGENLTPPLITTLTKVTGWSNQGGNIWRAPFSFAGMLQTVVIDDRIRAMGQWPDRDSVSGGFPTGGYRFVTSRDTTSPYTYIKDNLLDFSHRAQDLRTGQVVIRTNNTNISVANITSIGSDNQTINFTATPEDLPPSFAYFFRNAKSTLTKQYEWYFNDAKDSLYVYSTSAPTNVQVSTIDNCLKFNNVSYVVVDGLSFYGSDGELAVFTGGTKNTIKNCSLKYAGSNGVHINSSSSWAKITNTSVRQSCNSGIVYSGADAVVEGGEVVLAGWMPGMGSGGNGQYSGVSERGDRATLIGCFIDSVGQHGITFGRDGTKMINNFISHAGLVLSDAGDIYTAAPNWVKTRYPNKRLISGNIMMYGMGAKEGTSSWNKPDKLGSHHGIYFDGGTTDVIIENNTIYNMPWRAVYVNQSSNLVFRNNKFLNYTTISYQDTKSAWPIDSIIFQNNLCVAIGNKTSSSIEYASNRSTANIKYAWTPTDVNTNKYYQLLVPTSTTQMSLKGTGSSLPTWRTSLRSDANSSLGPLAMSDTSSTNSYRVLVNPSDTVKTFTLGGVTWLSVSGVQTEDNVAYKKNIATVPPHRSLFLVRTVGVPLDTTVSPNKAPTVALTSPTNNQQFTSPATVNLIATASDPDGSVTKVDFYNGNTLLFSDNTAPYSYSWTNVAAGNYNVSAKATDNLGLVTVTSSVPIIVNAPPTAPTVSLASPANNAIFNAGSTINVAANASTSTGTITTVDFYRGTTLLFSDNAAPYAYTWNNVPIGSYSLTAKATNSAGLSTTSGAINISVVDTTPTNIPPSVSLTSPAGGSLYTAPATISISAIVSDPDGTVSKVDFYNGSTLLGSDNTSPYSFTWSNVPVGNYSITAKATDNSGVTSSSSVAAVTVNPAPVAPNVALTSPANNSTFIAPASISIAATASDPDGTISKVEFFNGNTLLASDATAPYSFNWTGVGAGTYSITARATDNSGLATTSGIVNVVVNTPANQTPSATITSPANNASFTQPVNITINASAADLDGTIKSVDFYSGATLLGTDVTAPYSFTWNGVPAGNYSLTVVATDNANAQATSNPVSISVVAPNVLPSVAIVAPVTGAQYISPATINISANASDTDGVVSSVKFFNGTTLLATVTDAPYTFSWAAIPAGSYTITAVATDNSGATKTSAPVSVSVRNLVAPAATITSPANNSTYLSPATFAVNVSASDPDGRVTKVELYNGTTLVGTDTSSPYNYTVSGLAKGTYQLTAKAYDDDNLVTTSAAISILVNNPKIPPNIFISTPPNNSAYTDPASISMGATASDQDGFVVRVDFFNGTTLIASSYAAPYTLTWSSVMAGNYSIVARAIDNDSLTTSSAPISVTVTHINIPPTVEMITPATNDSAYETESVTLVAAAGDVDGTVTSVEIYANDSLLATIPKMPYAFDWADLKEGQYIVKAKAYDNSGAATVSQPITFRVVKKPYPIRGHEIIIVQ